MLHRLDPHKFEHVVYPDVENVVERPMQTNGMDCGVFVIKYIDCILTCNTQAWCGVEWNEDVITNFRRRIGWELHKNEARHLTTFSYDCRLAGL